MNPALPSLIFLLPFVGALLCAIAGWFGRNTPYRLTMAVLAATAAATLVASARVIGGGVLEVHMGGWAPPIGIEWRFDSLTAIATVMIAVVSLVILGGSHASVRRELPGRELPFYACSLLLVSGLMGMVMTGDLFNLFVHLEVVSLSAYALVASGGEGSARAAMKYLILGSLGASSYLLGVGFIFAATGTLNMIDAGALLAGGEPRVVTLALAFIVVGLGVKMGLYPLHGWMPAAYAKASVAGAALMAPLVTKVVAFVLIRIMLTVYGLDRLPSGAALLPLLAWAGALAMLAGSLLAIVQRDLRRLLAYSSIAQIGLVMLGLGLANVSGLSGALLHIVNDSLMKAALFMAAGVALLRFDVRLVSELPRLRGRARWTAAAFAVGGLSLVGIPPFCGFFGKWYLLAGALEARAWALAAMIVLGSVATAVYVFRILEQLYFTPASGDTENREGPGWMVGAVVLLAAGVIGFGLATERVVTTLIAPALGMVAR